LWIEGKVADDCGGVNMRSTRSGAGETSPLLNAVMMSVVLNGRCMFMENRKLMFGDLELPEILR
jgi:hypothetical protein